MDSPFEMHIYDMPYMEKALKMARIDLNRLARLLALVRTKLVRKMFAICFWIVVIQIKESNDHQDYQE